jgi:hypothetical protein
MNVFFKNTQLSTIIAFGPTMTMDQTDAAVVLLGSLLLVPLVGKLRWVVKAAFFFFLKWSVAAAVVAAAVMAVSETPQYRLLRQSLVGLLPTSRLRA